MPPACFILIQNLTDSCLHNAAQGVQPHLFRLDFWVLMEGKVSHLLQVCPNLVCQQSSGSQDEVSADSWAAPGDIPVGAASWSLSNSQQALVVVKYRSHLKDLHGGGVKQDAEIPIVPVRVQNDCIQYAHPPEGVFAPDPTKIPEKVWNRMFSAVEHRACLGQSYRFAGKQRTLGNQFPMVVVQVIQNRPAGK